MQGVNTWLPGEVWLSSIRSSCRFLDRALRQAMLCTCVKCQEAYSVLLNDHKLRIIATAWDKRRAIGHRAVADPRIGHA